MLGMFVERTTIRPWLGEQVTGLRRNTVSAA
jgi:hypothetical protein